MTITAMDVAKEAASLTMSVVVGLGLSTAISAATPRDEDDIDVRLASTLGGWYVSNRCRPQTDAMVEDAAAWFTKKRDAYRTRKAQA